MKLIVVFWAAVLSLAAPAALAGKVEDVKTEIKKSCGRDLSNEEALRQVKNLFLSCVPGHKVDVDGCKVSCLKENSGAVVGQ